MKTIRLPARSVTFGSAGRCPPMDSITMKIKPLGKVRIADEIEPARTARERSR
jgi:hypothetical protein